MKYKHVFFDLDRTLWDFEKNTEATLNEIYQSFSLNLYFQSFYDFYTIYKKVNEKQWELYRQGSITKEFLSTNRFYLTLSEAGNDNKDLAREIGKKYIHDTPLKTALYPYTHEVLSNLKQKYNMYILTNGFREVQHLKVNSCNLQKYFIEVITSEDCGYMKPSNDFFNYAINKLEVNTADCIMIGDDLNVDIIGAQNSGIDTIYLNHDLLKHSETPTYEINNLKQLLSIL